VFKDEYVQPLIEDGWEIECEDPFEIRHEDGGFASGRAATIVGEWLLMIENGEDEGVCV